MSISSTYSRIILRFLRKSSRKTNARSMGTKLESLSRIQKSQNARCGIVILGNHRPILNLIPIQSDDNCLKIIERLAPSERPLDILGHGAGMPLVNQLISTNHTSRSKVPLLLEDDRGSTV